MKAISRDKITKVIEHCYFKDISCGKTAKLLKIDKKIATANQKLLDELKFLFCKEIF